MRSITSRAERHISFKKALLSDDKRAFLLAEDEGFEPPQTESESGVLPLHKSSMWPFRLPRHKQHGYYSTETKNVKNFFLIPATFFADYRMPHLKRKYVPKRRENEKKLLKKGKQNGTMEM